MNKEKIVNKRTGVGAGIGALIGFTFAGPLGAGLGALLGGGVAHATGDPNRSVMTPRRKLIYERALQGVKNPADLKKLADSFAGEGLVIEADLLRKRAALRELPDPVKEQRRAFFRKAMASDNSDAILKAALAFMNEGAVDAAKALQEHAEAVRAAHLAGKTAKPMAGGSQEQFADKLAKAILHFGPASEQAVKAARNLIQSRGKEPTDALIREVLRIALSSLQVQAPPANGPPGRPIRIQTPGEPGPDIPPETVESQVESQGVEGVPESTESEGVPETAEATEAVEPAEVATTEATHEPAPKAPHVEEATVAEEAMKAEERDTGAPEPTKVGPPAPTVEPPAEIEAVRQAATVEVIEEGG